jgi:hypothetical protein
MLYYFNDAIGQCKMRTFALPLRKIRRLAHVHTIPWVAYRLNLITTGRFLVFVQNFHGHLTGLRMPKTLAQ